MGKKIFKNAELIDNLSHGCYYIHILGAQDIKPNHQECLNFKTVKGDVDIILDKTEGGKVIGIEILDNEA